MTWIVLSIFASSLIFLIFKLFEKQEVDNLTAIVINYFVAGTLGYLIEGELPSVSLLNSAFGLSALIVGFLFISLFNVMANVTQQNGVSVASVTNKMSVIIPVFVAFFLYGDALNFLKITGIIGAIAGIYLVTKKPNQNLKGDLLWPFVLFIGSGFLDTMLNYTEKKVIDTNQIGLFTPSAFFVAGIIGLGYLLVKRKKISLKSIGFGFVLGIPNYFSIFILLMALNTSGLESSIVFPINNMGVVLLSALLSRFLFKEYLSKQNLIGIGISLIAILVTAFSYG